MAYDADLNLSPVLRDFEAAGRHLLPEPLDQAAAGALLTRIRATRSFDGALFLTEAEFERDPQYTWVNPRPGRNLLDDLAGGAEFVEQAFAITSAMTELLGAGYMMLNRKAVCGVPKSAIPGWVLRRIAGGQVNNLGPYVRPEFRDITYFYGIDFHQDLIDYKERQADFVTLYVYLHPVTERDAPLYLLEGSHALGATVFPHALERAGQGRWRYEDRRGGSAEVTQRVLTGGTGFAAIWHACTLHGTQPDAADHERISLRYLFARGKGGVAGIDRVNATVRGPLSLPTTRLDLNGAGAAVLRGNTVNGA